MPGYPSPKRAMDEVQNHLVALREELIGGEDRVCLSVESIPLPLAIISLADGKVVDANRALEETFGYKRSRLVGRDAACLFPRLKDRRKLGKFAAVEGGVRGIEVQSRHRNGAAMWLSVWQQRAACNGKECLLTVLADITQEKLETRRQEELQTALKQLLKFSDQDRELIACDIHDGVIQDMTGALMHLEAARKAIETGRPDAGEQLKKVGQLLREGIGEARRLIDGVRAPDLEQVGLVGAVELLIDRIASTKGIAIEFTHRVSAERFSSQAETTIYRMVQECLNNIWRHSKSARARVELIQTDRVIRLTVQDWGVGFDPDQVDRTRFGLAGLRQRARLLDGMVLIRSAPGQGSTVRVTLPLTETVAAEATC
jgi:PAS domain S-box-containing protein